MKYKIWPELINYFSKFNYITYVNIFMGNFFSRCKILNNEGFVFFPYEIPITLAQVSTLKVIAMFL